jgi:hypothetical protein
VRAKHKTIGKSDKKKELTLCNHPKKRREGRGGNILLTKRTHKAYFEKKENKLQSYQKMEILDLL